ncbi:ribonuclease Z [Peribacillus sp. SCS-155]|uniref:ribonuclease Z n=1 Tax=Peribacillus sedimenti TaxID=3115297 RepID=UPI003906A095
MDLIFLGTGAAVPAKARNVSSIALQLLEERGTSWLFDCGEASQHQILRTPVKPGKIEKIFITHLHGDHIFGLPGLLGSRSFQGGTDELTVYGPKGIKEYIQTSLKVSGTHLRYKLSIMEIKQGTVFEDEQFIVSALPLEHGIYTIGYRIAERERPGRLLVEKLKDEGVKPGPHFKALKSGETITLEDGRVLNGGDYLDRPKRGRVIAILGDTRPCENAVQLARDADYLVHEATFSENETQMAYSYFHSTTAQAAQIAKDANAAKLILTHISSRYTLEDSQALQKESAAIFPETVVAHDLMRVKIPLYVDGRLEE